MTRALITSEFASMLDFLVVLRKRPGMFLGNDPTAEWLFHYLEGHRCACRWHECRDEPFEAFCSEILGSTYAADGPGLYRMLDDLGDAAAWTWFWTGFSNTSIAVQNTSSPDDVAQPDWWKTLRPQSKSESKRAPLPPGKSLLDWLPRIHPNPAPFLLRRSGTLLNLWIDGWNHHAVRVHDYEDALANTFEQWLTGEKYRDVCGVLRALSRMNLNLGDEAAFDWYFQELTEFRSQTC